jgi:DNA-binding NarL/FixJ family response regulator
MNPLLTVLPPARLLLVEDHPLYREGLLGLLQRRAPQLQCRVADTGAEALRLLQGQTDTDLVLADLHLPGAMDGLALLDRIGQDHPTVARVLVSGSDDPHLGAQARRAGLMGYLPKAMDPTLWELALARILGGEPWFPREALTSVEAGPTGRQAVILVRLAEGRSNKAIASELGITERTVKYHLSELYGRLGAANRAEAVARASTRGWLRLPQSA